MLGAIAHDTSNERPWPTRLELLSDLAQNLRVALLRAIRRRSLRTRDGLLLFELELRFFVWCFSFYLYL